MNRVEPTSWLRWPRLRSAGPDHAARPSHDAHAPVDIASLVFFRIAFGAIMFWEFWRYWLDDRIRQYWIEPSFHFTYFGLEWVKPLPGNGLYVYWIGLGVLSVFMMIGLWYRVSAALFCLGFTYQFLLEQARYLNHFYLISLISLLMVCVPAHRALSVDAWRRPALRSQTAPAWSLWLLRAQVGIAYFYGGLAKLNADWLHGEPMRGWLAKREHYPLLGPIVHSEWTVAFFSYGGLCFDLLIVPLLLWRRTRAVAFAAAVFFHLMNSWMFSIGIFPWFMIPATLLFFPPDWPRRLLRRVLGERMARVAQQPAPERRQGRERLVTALVGTYLAVQFLVPLRHHLYPGDVNWTEEGHRFSWHMMLRSKKADALFYVTDTESRHTWLVDPEHHLTRWQDKKMAGRPDMLLQFAHHLADLARQDGYASVEVRARVKASLNRREAQLLIDPEVDLAAERRTLAAVPWIRPQDRPLRLPRRD